MIVKKFIVLSKTTVTLNPVCPVDEIVYFVTNGSAPQNAIKNHNLYCIIVVIEAMFVEQLLGVHNKRY